jgi:hypothetical protein
VRLQNTRGTDFMRIVCYRGTGTDVPGSQAALSRRGGACSLRLLITIATARLGVASHRSGSQPDNPPPALCQCSRPLHGLVEISPVDDTSISLLVSL